MAITGPSGGGKSTLVGVIGGLAQPTSGVVRIGDFKISELSERTRSDFRRKHIGFVYQADNLLPFLTLLENVGLQLSLNGKSSGAGLSLAVLAERAECGCSPARMVRILMAHGISLQRYWYEAVVPMRNREVRPSCPTPTLAAS